MIDRELLLQELIAVFTMQGYSKPKSRQKAEALIQRSLV